MKRYAVVILLIIVIPVIAIVGYQFFTTSVKSAVTTTTEVVSYTLWHGDIDSYMKKLESDQDFAKKAYDSYLHLYQEYFVYTIVYGDTLWKIGARFALSKDKMMALITINHITNINLIITGNTLKIPR